MGKQARIAKAVDPFLGPDDRLTAPYFIHSALCMARSELMASPHGVGEWLPTPPPPGSRCRAHPMILFVVRNDAKWPSGEPASPSPEDLASLLAGFRGASIMPPPFISH